MSDCSRIYVALDSVIKMVVYGPIKCRPVAMTWGTKMINIYRYTIRLAAESTFHSAAMMEKQSLGPMLQVPELFHLVCQASLNCVYHYQIQGDVCITIKNPQLTDSLESLSRPR